MMDSRRPRTMHVSPNLAGQAPRASESVGVRVSWPDSEPGTSETPSRSSGLVPLMTVSPAPPQHYTRVAGQRYPGLLRARQSAGFAANCTRSDAGILRPCCPAGPYALGAGLQSQTWVFGQAT
jgi:hypothetical protein